MATNRAAEAAMASSRMRTRSPAHNYKGIENELNMARCFDLMQPPLQSS